MREETLMLRRIKVWVFVSLVVFSAVSAFAQDNYLTGDKMEVILGPTDKTGVQIIKAGTSIILKGVCQDALTKFTVWRLQQKFGNITDLTVLSREALEDLQTMEQSFSEDLSLSFNTRDSAALSEDLKFKIIEGRLVVSGYANNMEDITKIQNIAKIYDNNPVINVDMRKDMIEIDAIFCRIQRSDGSKFGTEGLQSAKIVIPSAGYTYTGEDHTNSSDAVKNDGGIFSSLDHELSVGVNPTNLINVLTSHFRVTEEDVKILVRPHLSTLNGQEAIFHSGGQQPFEIATQNVQNIDWKDYGTKLSITPTLTTEGLIEVDINIELIIPLNDAEKRFTKFSHNGRAILNQNEALVLSGLIQQLYQMDIERTPFLGKVPILNFFFSAKDRSHDQEEMAIVVMPRRPAIAKPEVVKTMMGSDQMQNIIIDTVPKMGPVPEIPQNRRSVK